MSRDCLSHCNEVVEGYDDNNADNNDNIMMPSNFDSIRNLWEDKNNNTPTLQTTIATRNLQLHLSMTIAIAVIG